MVNDIIKFWVFNLIDIDYHGAHGAQITYWVFNLHYNVYCAVKKSKKFSMLTDFIPIGIELWSNPHISEHCP